MVATGIEIPVIISVARTLKSTVVSQSTSSLQRRATTILNDKRLIKLLQKLYQLNEIQAIQNYKRYAKARSICLSIDRSKGTRNILTRHSKARRACRLAVKYEAYVEMNTADALQKALWDEEERKMKLRAHRQKNKKTIPVEETLHSLATDDSDSEENTDLNTLMSDQDNFNPTEGETLFSPRRPRRPSAVKPSNHLHRGFSFGIHSHDRYAVFCNIETASESDHLASTRLILYPTGYQKKSNLGSVNVGQENSREQVASQRSPVEDHNMSEGSQHIKNEEPESSHGKRGSNSHDTSDSKDVAEAARVVVTAITTYDDEDDDDRAISIATSFTFDLDSEGNNGKGLSNDENYDSDEDEDSEVNESDYESFESEDDENKREEAVDDDLEA
ncbi:hypothetical protein EV360DRAFT_68496 [Lentinula raphanica]|nr:hypothetical protein EV360DRAFT_68496 [Lentinula raphanica]